MRLLAKSELTYALALPALTWGLSMHYFGEEVFAMHNRVLVELFAVLAFIIRRLQVRQWQIRNDLHTLELITGMVLAATAAIVVIGWINGSVTLWVIMLASCLPFLFYLWESPLDLWFGELLNEWFPPYPKARPAGTTSVLIDGHYVPVDQLLR